MWQVQVLLLALANVAQLVRARILNALLLVPQDFKNLFTKYFTVPLSSYP